MSVREEDEARIAGIYTALKSFATANGLAVQNPVPMLDAVVAASPPNAFETGPLVIPIRVIADDARDGPGAQVDVHLSDGTLPQLTDLIADGWRAQLRVAFERNGLPLPSSLVTPEDPTGEDDAE